jgi:hypothetical protein
MTYEEIWQKVKRMSQRNRRLLAYEMTHRGIEVGYIHPHYYFDAKAVHDILFYPSDSQHEIKDKNGTYYNALKRIIENDEEIHVRVKRFAWLLRFINDWREGKIVKAYICSRINEEYVSAWYKILPGKSLAGERSRSLFLTRSNGSEIVYKMTECSHKNGYELLTFSRTDIS